MWGRAQVLALLTVALAAYGDDVHSDDSKLKVGSSINIFTRYGYLSLSMKVVPSNNYSDWIFREPTVDIFTDDLDRFATRPDRAPKKRRRVFDGDFHMEFCDNQKQLLQAYFRDFQFEGLDKSWRAFTSSWSPEVLARNLGINSSFVHKQHKYVLVRLVRYREQVTLDRIPNNINLEDVVAREIDNMRRGDEESVIRFIMKYGSHYIHSFITGNSIYQVFVFNNNNYEKIKSTLKTKGIARVSNQQLLRYFSPLEAEHLGAIRVASGNRTVERWASSSLEINHNNIFTYTSLLKIHGDTDLLKWLNAVLTNEAILKIDMKTLAPAFKDPAKRLWFEEVLDNVLKLWESNL